MPILTLRPTALAAAVLVLMLVRPHHLASQAPPDEKRVEQLLRSALPIMASRKLYITRDYDRPRFPAATFYRAMTDVTDIPVPLAGVVVIDTTYILVRSVADLTQVWALAASPQARLPGDLSNACARLLRDTGLLIEDDHNVNRAADLPRLLRQSLEPASALRQIHPPTNQRMGARQEAVFFTWDANGVHRFECSATGDALHVADSTIADAGPGA